MSLINRMLARFAPSLSGKTPSQAGKPESKPEPAALQHNERPFSVSAPPDQTDACPPASPQNTDEQTNDKTSGQNATEKLSICEHREKLLRFCLDKLCEMAASMPETGKCDPCGLGLKYYGTENNCYIIIECDLRDPSLRRIIARSVRQGTDLAISHHMAKGTKSEMIAWLQQEESIEQLLQSFQQLSDAVDDKW